MRPLVRSMDVGARWQLGFRGGVKGFRAKFALFSAAVVSLAHGLFTTGAAVGVIPRVRLRVLFFVGTSWVQYRVYNPGGRMISAGSLRRVVFDSWARLSWGIPKSPEY